jgi:hypothetical protein
MIAITHLVVSLLLIELLTLDRNDAFVALLFGVFIDFDHLIGLKDYAKANGIRAVFDLDSLTHADGQWKSLLHSPVAIAVVGPISVASRLMIPLLFWGVHISMDFVEESFLGNFSTPEAMLLAISGIGLVTIRYGKYLQSYAAGTFSQYLRIEFGWLKGIVRPSTV